MHARRVRAVLAAGLVLGVGTAVTLAAWTDGENATGTFGASVFDTESRTQASPTYASNTSAPGATLSFGAADAASSAGGMSPGKPFYAWLNVRTTPTSTVGGAVSLTTTKTGGTLPSVLQYRAVRTTSPQSSSACGAAAFAGTPVFIAGGPTMYLPASQVPSTAVPSTIGAAGAELGFCFEVQIVPGTPNSFQGAQGTVTWTFTATSEG